MRIQNYWIKTGNYTLDFATPRQKYLGIPKVDQTHFTNPFVLYLSVNELNVFSTNK